MKQFIKIGTTIIRKEDIVKISLFTPNIDEDKENWNYCVRVQYKFFDEKSCVCIFNEEKGELSKEIAKRDLDLLYDELNY